MGCGLNLITPHKVAFRNTTPATEIVDQPARRLKLDSAEPGDPPNADYKSVRAKPLAKPISYPGLTREVELELVRRWRENGDEMALERLVGAHRPMVVNMARHRIRSNGTSLTALIEYGMLGVRLAAEPPRPSQTKKAKMVGFDPATGHRFSTYARHHADKQMRAALSDVRWEPSPDFNSEPDLALAAGVNPRARLHGRLSWLKSKSPERLRHMPGALSGPIHDGMGERRIKSLWFFPWNGRVVLFP